MKIALKVTLEKNGKINGPKKLEVFGASYLYPMFLRFDVVEFFAPRGAETTIIEMMPVIGNGLDASSTSSMKECMEKHHVRQMTNTALQKVNAHSFLVKYDGKEEELPFDYGFVCLGMRANCLILRQNQERTILKTRTDSHGAACIMYRILCAIRWWRDRNSSISRHSALAIF